MLAANGILMDAFYTDVRPAWRTGASRAGCRPTRWRPTRRRAIRPRSNRSGSAAPRPAGEHDDHDESGSCRADRPVQPAGLGSEEHQLRRREHLGQGRRDGSGHGEPVELLWVKGPAAISAR